MEVYNVALRMLGEPAAAEDAAQDAFLRAFSRIDLYREGEPFGAWLHGIVRNRCLDVLRTRSRAAAAYPIEPVSAVDAEVSALRHVGFDLIQEGRDDHECRITHTTSLRLSSSATVESTSSTH